MCLAGAWMTEKYFARHLMHVISIFDKHHITIKENALRGVCNRSLI
jgi:hypothetical protein